MISQGPEASVDGKLAGLDPDGNFLPSGRQLALPSHDKADWPDSPSISEGFCPTEIRIRDLRARQTAPPAGVGAVGAPPRAEF